MIHLDGSIGGGQLLRTALALSLHTGKGFTIDNIRINRAPKPGLQAQHLTCIEAARAMCANAIIEGATKDSLHLRFVPGKFQPKSMALDIGTAGSVTLLLQSLLPALIVGNKRIGLELTGGTTGKWAMPLAYFEQVFLPQLRKFADVNVELIRRGYYPAGGGKIKFSIKPLFTAKTVNNAPTFSLLDQGKLLYIKGVSHASTTLQDARVAQRQAESCKLALKQLGENVHIETEYADTLCPGSGIVVWSVHQIGSELDMQQPIRLGADGLGEKGKPAEDVGFAAANGLLAAIESKTPVDKYLADNLIPYLAIFKGRIRVQELTPHVRANILVCEAFLGKLFDVNEEDRIISVLG